MQLDCSVFNGSGCGVREDKRTGFKDLSDDLKPDH